jgi:hypothetical protein
MCNRCSFHSEVVHTLGSLAPPSQASSEKLRLSTERRRTQLCAPQDRSATSVFAEDARDDGAQLNRYAFQRRLRAWDLDRT